MKKILKYAFCLTIAATLTATATAQNYNEENNLFYHAFRVPQSNDLNPAFFPASNTLYISLPGLTRLQFDAPLAIGDMLSIDTVNHITNIDLNKISDAMSENSQLNFGLNMNLIGGGLRIGNTFITASLGLKTKFDFTIPYSTVDFLLHGNLDENGVAGRSAEILTGDLFNMHVYGEAGIGIGHRIPIINLTIGARAKIYYGLAHISFRPDIKLTTDQNIDAINATINYQLGISSPIPINLGGNGLSDLIDINALRNKGVMGALKYLVSPEVANMSVGFDLGAKYQIGPFAISASVIDLTSGLHWHNNVYSIGPSGGAVDTSFAGFDVQQLLNNGSLQLDTLLDSYASLLGRLVPDSVLSKGGDYYYTIPTKINIGASVSLGTFVRAGILFHGQFDRGLLTNKNDYDLYTLNNYHIDFDKKKDKFRYNTTLSANVNLLNWLEVVAGSSIVYDGSKIDPLNPGVGFIITPLSAAQFYLMADYVSSIYLVEEKGLNIKFGFNLLIGHGGRRKML